MEGGKDNIITIPLQDIERGSISSNKRNSSRSGRMKVKYKQAEPEVISIDRR